MNKTTPTAVDEMRDLILEALENHRSEGYMSIAIDNTPSENDSRIGLINQELGLVWLVTVQRAEFVVTAHDDPTT